MDKFVVEQQKHDVAGYINLISTVDIAFNAKKGRVSFLLVLYLPTHCRVDAVLHFSEG